MNVIIDYNMGNVGSITRMLNKVGAEAKLTSDHEEIERARRIILPGVGAFDAGMRHLTDMRLIDLLTRKVLEEKVPVLGICLGMQLLAKNSEEGGLPGLDWIDAEARRFHFDAPEHQNLKIPHIGWNYVDFKTNNALKLTNQKEWRFYFVHSYYMDCAEQNDILGETTYGRHFTSAVNHGHIYGVQFHPEKSHKFGMAFFQSFLEST